MFHGIVQFLSNLLSFIEKFIQSSQTPLILLENLIFP